MFVSEEKQWFALPSLLSYESLVSVKENINKERKKRSKKERKKILKYKSRFWRETQNSTSITFTTQTKLKAPHVRCNVKILPQ